MRSKSAFAFIAALASSAFTAQAQVFTVLHAFAPATTGSPATNLDGTLPQGGLVLQAGTLYGTAAYGGTNGSGTLFSCGINGSNFTVLHAFAPAKLPGSSTNSEGMTPLAGPVLLGGTLYGVAELGGTNGNGTIYSISTNGTGFSLIHTFTPTRGAASTNTDGANPVAGLTGAGDTLYGATFFGGTNGTGTIFSLRTNGLNFSVIHSFRVGHTNRLNEFTNADGTAVQGTLLLSGGTLYGTTAFGSTNASGNVFSLGTNGANFAVLHTFPDTFGTLATNVDGAQPFTGVAMTGSQLFGTALYGGTNGSGTVFSLNTNGANFQVLHTFDVTNSDFLNADGAQPLGTLVAVGNTLYGTANVEGPAGNGTTFSLTTDGTQFALLHVFSATVGNTGTNFDGASPVPLLWSANTLYGAAASGGANASGTIYSFQFPQPNIAGVVANPNSTITLNCTGSVNNTYIVQAATSLSAPINWQTISTNVAGSNGLWQVTDAGAPGLPQRFYRLSTP